MNGENTPETPWPGYREFPERLNLACEVLGAPAERGVAARPALLGEAGALTYGALEERVNALAAGLLSLGVERGDLALVVMGNRVEFAVAFLAVVKIGAVPVLVNSLLSAAELAGVVEEAAPRLVFTEGERASAVRELARRGRLSTIVCADGAESTELSFSSLLASDARSVGTADTSAHEPAFIVYTSGTTGRPKGIVHAHRWIVALGDLNRYRLPPQPDDVVMATGEWSFISALGHNVLFPLRNGVTGAIFNQRATPENILNSVERCRVTVLHSVATVYRRLLASPGFEERHDLRRLRCAHSTGEALREATYREWKRRVGCELFEHYGVSEYQLVVGHGARYPVKPASVGKFLPGVGAAILDDDCRPVARGDLGQFAISRQDPGLFLGYYKDPERSRAAFRNGWYFTGDLAYQDAEGYVFIAGRRDDCFKSRGIFISPAEIENALQQLPAIVEAAVVPQPDGEIGNRIRAVVVLASDQTPSESLARSLREALRERIAPFKVPHTIEFVSNLPKSAVGKILRSEITRGANSWSPEAKK